MVVPPNFITRRPLGLLGSLLSIRSAVANHLQHRRLHLVQRHAGGIDIHRVRRLHQRRVRARSVAPVALPDLLAPLPRPAGPIPRRGVPPAPPVARPGKSSLSRREKQPTRYRALPSPPTRDRRFALLRHQRAPHARNPRHLRRRSPTSGARIASLTSSPFSRTLPSSGRIRWPPALASCSSRYMSETATFRRSAHNATHGTSLRCRCTNIQFGRDAPRERALSRPRRSIDRHCDAFGQIS